MKITIRNVRLAFPRIYEAQEPPDGGAPTFNATFIVEDPKVRSQIEEAITQAAREKWADKAESALRSIRAQGRICHKDGEQKAEYEGFEGNTFVSSRTKAAPAVFDTDGTKLQQRDGKPYPGCYVDASLEIWAQDNSYGKRVNAQLRGIKFVADATPFAGGGVATEDDFEFEPPADDAPDDLI